MVELAAKCGVPSVLLGAGMSEISDVATLDYIRKVYNSDSVLLVLVRDEMVAERVKRCGVAAEKVSVWYDPTYMFDACTFDTSEYMTEIERLLYTNDNTKICISFASEIDVMDRDHIDEVR